VLPSILFVSDAGLNDVYMYSLPDMTLEGTLTGFNNPQGMCSDTSGNVYVVNTGTAQVFKISRAGTIVATYTDTVGIPLGCAVDPATGNLAVSDYFQGSGPGQVLVYTGPSATPTVLSNPAQYYYYFLG
jgi:DNA-binding beta-propeller fold protein YncE